MLYIKPCTEFYLVGPGRVLKSVISDGQGRQIPTKNRSLWFTNEQFEGQFNALRPSAVVFQHSTRHSW